MTPYEDASLIPGDPLEFASEIFNDAFEKSKSNPKFI